MILNRILVAIDFSADSEPALDAALDLARRNDGRVTLLHVCQPPPYSTPNYGMFVPSPDELADVLIGARQALVEYKKRCAAKGATVDTALVTGPPAEEIVRYATVHDFDLVVVGSHGRRGFRRFVLGSVAEAVVRTADRPVLTVHRQQPSEATAGGSR